MAIDIQNLSFNFKTQNIFENTTVSFTEEKVKSRLLWRQTVEVRQRY